MPMTRTTDKRAIELSWKLLAYKLMYYHPEKVHESWHKELVISDQEYDALEQEAIALGLTKKVDFPTNTPSGILVMDKYSSPKGTKHEA